MPLPECPRAAAPGYSAGRLSLPTAMRADCVSTRRTLLARAAARTRSRMAGSSMFWMTLGRTSDRCEPSRAHPPDSGSMRTLSPPRRYQSQNLRLALPPARTATDRLSPRGSTNRGTGPFAGRAARPMYSRPDGVIRMERIDPYDRSCTTARTMIRISSPD